MSGDFFPSPELDIFFSITILLDCLCSNNWGQSPIYVFNIRSQDWLSRGIEMTKKFKESEAHTRTVVKAVSWRVIATLTTMTIVYTFTREFVLTLGIGFFEVTCKILFFYLHERLWQRIRWGKERHPLSELKVKRELEPEDMEIIRNKLKELGYLD